MAKHIVTGQQGEALAVAYFNEKGFDILHTNWKHNKWEVDIIASHENILHFIEVKTRTNNKFGFPEESVDKKKIQNLINASEEYLHQNPQWQRIQFDVLAINLHKNEPSYFYIEDVYL